MKRRFVSWAAILGVGFACSQVVRATVDHFDDAEKVCAEQLRLIGYSMWMYLQDWDEAFPLAYEREHPNAPWRWNQMGQVPPGWHNLNAPNGDGIWANALLPYVRMPQKRPNPWRCPAAIPEKVEGVDYTVRSRSPYGVSYTYNGYLHNLTLAHLENPMEQIPAVWEGLGRTYIVGFAPVNPYLRCDNPSLPCRYQRCVNPNAHYPRGEVRLPSQSMWIHTRGMFLVSIWGYLRAMRVGARFAPNDTDLYQDPFTQYNLHGVPGGAHTDACGYMPMFAPF